MFLCTQEPTLFSTSIAENIRYGAIDAECVSDDQLWDASKMANAEVFIRHFLSGLDTLKSNQIKLFYSAPKSWTESWPT